MCVASGGVCVEGGGGSFFQGTNLTSGEIFAISRNTEASKTLIFPVGLRMVAVTFWW